MKLVLKRKSERSIEVPVRKTLCTQAFMVDTQIINIHENVFHRVLPTVVPALARWKTATAAVHFKSAAVVSDGQFKTMFMLGHMPQRVKAVTEIAKEWRVVSVLA